MISARRWSWRTDLTIDTAGSGSRPEEGVLSRGLPASASHTAAGASERASSSITVRRVGRGSPGGCGPRCPVHTRFGCDGDPAVARAEEEVRVDLPAV